MVFPQRRLGILKGSLPFAGNVKVRTLPTYPNLSLLMFITKFRVEADGTSSSFESGVDVRAIDGSPGSVSGLLEVAVDGDCGVAPMGHYVMHPACQ